MVFPNNRHDEPLAVYDVGGGASLTTFSAIRSRFSGGGGRTFSSWSATRIPSAANAVIPSDIRRRDFAGMAIKVRIYTVCQCAGGTCLACYDLPAHDSHIVLCLTESFRKGFCDGLSEELVDMGGRVVLLSGGSLRGVTEAKPAEGLSTPVSPALLFYVVASRFLIAPHITRDQLNSCLQV